MAKKATNNLGNLAENFAVKLLLSKGYKIIDRNFHSRFGEIDIIALKDGYLIFVEVKARWNLKYGYPEEAVTPAKIWKIKKTGEYFSLLHSNLSKSLRIQVVSLLFDGESVSRSKIIDVYES